MISHGKDIKIFTGNANPKLAADICKIIGTKLGESEVKSHTDLTHAVKQYSAGDTAELVIYRAGETLTLSITFDEEVPENSSGSASAMPGQVP